MKKFFMIAAMMVAALTVNAQNEVGQISIQPKIGMNLSSLRGDDDAKMMIGLAGGLEAEYGVAENFGIAVGALYSMQGAKAKFPQVGTLKFHVDYIIYNCYNQPKKLPKELFYYFVFSLFNSYFV